MIHHPAYRILVLVSRLLVGAIFMWAAIPKLMDPQAFAESIANYHLLPTTMVPWVAVITPILEFITALGLILGVVPRASALTIAGMLVVFSIAIAQAITRGIDIDCGCFGSTVQSEVSWLSLVRNAALLVGTLIVLSAQGPWWALFSKSSDSSA